MAQRAGEGPRRPRRTGADLTRLLCLGDSYTAGEAVAAAEAWPSVVAATIEGISLEVVAATSWTCRELLDAIEDVGPEGPYDVVTVQVGVNDQYRGHPLKGFARDYAEVLATATGLTVGPGWVIAVSIPDWSVTPHAADRDRAAVAADIDRFNEAACRAAEDHGAGWIDVTTSSREAADDPGLLAEDGLHPSAGMYLIWSEALIPEILRRIS